MKKKKIKMAKKGENEKQNEEKEEKSEIGVIIEEKEKIVHSVCQHKIFLLDLIEGFSDFKKIAAYQLIVNRLIRSSVNRLMN